MNILIGYGTRPEFIKLKPLIEEISGEISIKTIRFLQHTDLVHSDADHTLSMNPGNNRLDSIISSIERIPPEVFQGITHVLVQGDTHSALALALAGFHRQIPIIHLEAGLRTYDLLNPYPEEATRQLVSRIASIHLCPTELNKNNLEKEGVQGSIHVCGNTGLDSLLPLRKTARYSDDVYITLHRRENIKLIPEWFSALDRIATENPHLNFVLPIHPNPNIKEHSYLLKTIKVVDPISPHDFKVRLASAKFIITDSGGIQEESVFLGKRCIILRQTTERPEALGIGSILCTSPQSLPDAVKAVDSNYVINPSDVFGDGRSSRRIKIILKELL